MDVFGKLRAKQKAIGLSLLIVVAASIWYLAPHLPEPTFSLSPSDTPQEASDTDASISKEGPGPYASAAQEKPSTYVAAPTLPQLPDTSTPLVQQLGTLVERASGGDPVSSCRLALSINKCTTERHSRDFAEKLLKSLEAKPAKNEDLMIDTLSRAEENIEGYGDYCKDVDVKSLPNINSILKNSIGNLSPQQKTILALMRSDGQIRRLQSRGPYSEPGTYVLSQVIAENAYDFLRSGYEAREPLALEGLIMVHAPGPAIMPQGVSVRLPNPQLFLKYAALFARLYGPDALGQQGNQLVAATMATMHPDELEVIRTEVNAEAKRWLMIYGRERLHDGETLPRDDSNINSLQGCEN